MCDPECKHGLLLGQCATCTGKDAPEPDDIDELMMRLAGS